MKKIVKIKMLPPFQINYPVSIYGHGLLYVFLVEPCYILTTLKKEPHN